MSTTKELIYNGGTAFPHTTINNLGGFVLQPGMSLRDWFAGMALQGLTSNAQWTTAHELSETAYAIADIMLEARKGSSHE
jgi:hypothetical protein